MRGLLVALLVLLLPLSAATAQSLADDAVRARLLFSQQKYAEAAQTLQQIQDHGNPTPADLILLGMCYTELKELDKAEAVLARAAMISPRNAPLLDARANLAFAQKRFADALALFRDAHGLAPDDRNAIAGMVASLGNLGVELYGQGKVEEARKAFLEAIQLDPGSVSALRNMAVLELDTGDAAASARYLERALAISPDVQLLKLLFLARNNQGDMAAMLPILDRLIAMQPADPEPYAAKARLLEQEGKTAEAAAVFQQAVDRGTQDPLPYLRVGAAKRDRFILQQAVGKAVQLISALEIEASQSVGKARKAADLRGARLLTSKVDDVRATLASSLSLLREIDGDALFQEDLTRLQSWYPGSVDLLAALGMFFQQKEKWSDSLAAWPRILDTHPVNEEAQEGAALAFEKLGNVDQAILAYRRAREMAPDKTGLYAALERLYAGREDELRQILLDASYRETRNVVLLRELAKLEGELGLKADSESHLARIAEIEAGR